MLGAKTGRRRHKGRCIVDLCGAPPSHHQPSNSAATKTSLRRPPLSVRGQQPSRRHHRSHRRPAGRPLRPAWRSIWDLFQPPLRQDSSDKKGVRTPRGSGFGVRAIKAKASHQCPQPLSPSSVIVLSSSCRAPNSGQAQGVMLENGAAAACCVARDAICWCEQGRAGQGSAAAAAPRRSWLCRPGLLQPCAPPSPPY